MPYLKDGRREYRGFASVEPLDEGSAGFVVEGYALVYDEAYPFGQDGAMERIDRNALVGADMGDVIFQLNHEGQTLARLRNGTLRLDSDDHGLRVRADLGGSAPGRELYESIRNGLIDQMSWGFSIAEGGWEWDPVSRTSTITKVAKVYDVSAVSIPANPATELHARSYLDGVIEAERQELLRRDRERRRRVAMALEMTEQL